MSIYRLMCISALAVLLSACATPQTPRQAIYAASAAYDAALKTTLVYARLPRCGQPASPAVCSDQALVTEADRWAQLAQPSVLAALDLARDTAATDSALSQALSAAQLGVAAFTATALKLH